MSSINRTVMNSHASPPKNIRPRFGPKRSNQFFCDLKHESILLSVPKNIRDCVQSHDDSNDTSLDPSLLSFSNTFKGKIES